MKPYGMGMPIPIFLSPKPSGVSQFVRGIYLAEIHALNGNTFVQRLKM